MVSSTRNAGLKSGHGAYPRVDLGVPALELSFDQSSSAKCGANGWRRIRKLFKADAGLVSQVMASLIKTINAEMAVLNRRPSRSSVTFLIAACSALSCSGVH